MPVITERYPRLSSELWSAGDLIDMAAEPAIPGTHREFGLTMRRGAMALFPLGNRRAAADAMLRWTDADGPADVALRSLAWCGARAGLLRFMTEDRVGIRTVSVPGAPQTLHEYLAGSIGSAAVEISCAFGSTRPNQKPVVRIHSNDGSTLGFAKIGWNETSRALIENEAGFLAASADTPTSTFDLPRVIHRGTWNGRSVSITTPLMGRAAFRRHAGPDVAVMEEIAALGDAGTASLAASSYRASLEPRLARMRPKASSTAREAIREIDRRWSQLPLRFGRWHGDWTPWNMTTRNGRPIVWDWERTAPSVPVGFDLLHYAFHRCLASGRVDPARCLIEAAGSVAPSLRAIDVEGSRFDATICLYVLEMHVRFGDATVDERSEPGWIKGLLKSAIQHYPVR